MKRLNRVLSCVLIIAIVCSVLAISVSAYECSSGKTSSGQRTYYIYHHWGNAASLRVKTAGTGRTVLGQTISTSGKFTYTVKNPNGKVIKKGTWKPDSDGTIVLVNAFAKTGRYTITVSGAGFSNKFQDRWLTYPNYKIVYK